MVKVLVFPDMFRSGQLQNQIGCKEDDAGVASVAGSDDRHAHVFDVGYVWHVSGGPAMIRAAAKNHEDVAVVVDPADYQDLLASLGGGEGRADFYRRLAWKAFQHTAGYDALVSEWFWGQIGAAPRI
jgi:hypothetical protein